MNTFLFAWNPDKWKWDDLDECVSEYRKTGKTKQIWSCASHKKVKIGDRGFLIKLGKIPKGIFGSGTIVSEPILLPHYSKPSKEVYRVYLEFDILIHPYNEQILPLNLLNLGKLSSQHWTTESSGISIKEEVVEELEAVWFEYNKDRLNSNLTDSHSDNYNNSFSEGERISVLTSKYERNPHARKICIDTHGTTCKICEINFKQDYGDIGKGYIHVHHVNPISSIGRKYEIDPTKDLVPVCPNCHVMIHKRNPPFTIEEMKTIYKNGYKKNSLPYSSIKSKKSC